MHPTLGHVVPPIDPDKEERRDQRAGTLLVVLAYGALVLVAVSLLAWAIAASV